MERLSRILSKHGYPTQEVMIIGDRANLNDELAIAYKTNVLRYLAGLQPQKNAHKGLLGAFFWREVRRHPLGPERGSKGYWGLPCWVSFEHEGERVTHKALLVVSGPVAEAVWEGRAVKLRALRGELSKLRAKTGEPRCRTVK